MTAGQDRLPPFTATDVAGRVLTHETLARGPTLVVLLRGLG